MTGQYKNPFEDPDADLYGKKVKDYKIPERKAPPKKKAAKAPEIEDNIMKIYKITYIHNKSGCTGHEEYFLDKRNAEEYLKKGCYPHCWGPNWGSKLEEITVKYTLNFDFEMEETGDCKRRKRICHSSIHEGKKAALNKILDAVSNKTGIIGNEELKEIEEVVNRIEGPIIYKGYGAQVQPYTKWIDGKELAKMIADYLNLKWKERKKLKGGKTK